MKTESKESPKIEKLQGQTLIPCCIEQKTRTNNEQAETYYQYSVIKMPLDTNTSFTNLKKLIVTELMTHNDAYIYSKYKSGTQQSMQAIFADPDTTEGVKTLIKSVWNWIRKTGVLPYYYGKKVQIGNAGGTDVLLSICWDFSQFDATDPDVKLSDLI